VNVHLLPAAAGCPASPAPPAARVPTQEPDGD